MESKNKTLITLSPFWLEKKLFYSLASIVFLSTLFFSCESRSLSKTDQEKVTGFFEELLLEHGGAYTLFGSKPITMESLLDLSEEALIETKAYLEAHPEVETFEVERKFEEGWNIWKKRSQPKNFLLKEVALNDSQILVFMNRKTTIATLEKYYEDFKEIVGCEFDPQQVVLDFQEKFWQNILLSHKARGILLGYGYRNASLFGNGQHYAIPSENNDPRLPAAYTLNRKPFRIPIFAVLDPTESHQLILRYKQEREHINKIYDGQDFLKVTLNRLYGKS